MPRDDKLLTAIEGLVKMEIPRGELGDFQASAPRAAKLDDEKPKDSKPAKSRTRSRSSKSKEPETEAVEAKAPEPEKTEKPRSRGGRGRGRNEDRGPKVVGLGDHLPTFIEKSFEERRTAG